MEPVFQVTIVGGGNLAHASIATIGHLNPRFKINLLTRRPEVWQKKIVAYTQGSHWESRGDLVGEINMASADAQDVIPGSDVVIVCSPGHTKIGLLEQIRDHLEPGTLVGSIFGQGAFDWQATHALGAEKIKSMNWTIFSLQYVPFICKAVNYGKDINIIGPKKHLYATCSPLEKIHYVCNSLSHLYFIPVIPIPGFLNLTLCPSNQIIHPGRVYNQFKDWDGESSFEASTIPKLYEDLDEGSAQEISWLDEEIQAIKTALLAKFGSKLSLPQVIPINERICAMYEGQVSDKSSLKRIFNTNLGYSRVPFPMVPKDPADPTQVVLNKNARFFWEDVPYGLCILKDIGRIMGVPTPHMTKQIVWHQKFMPIKYVDEETGEFIKESIDQTGCPSRYGINTPEKLVETSMLQSAAAQQTDIFMSQHVKFAEQAEESKQEQEKPMKGGSSIFLEVAGCKHAFTADGKYMGEM